MRSGLIRLASTSAVVLSGLVALATITPAHAQPKPAAKPAASAKPAAPKAGAKPDAKAGAKPDAKAAKPDAKAAKPDAKAAKPDAKDAKAAKPDKDACAAEPKPKLAEGKKKDEAKKAYKAGEAKFDKGDMEPALACYRLADAYIPGAAPKFKIAVVLDKLGKTVEAVAAYEAFLATNPPEDKYKEKIAEAKSRTESLKQTPSKVTIATTPANLPNLKVTLDGAPQAGTEIMVPPGKHTLVVTADGYDATTTPLEIGFAEKKDLPVTLNPKAPEPVATVQPTAQPTATATAVAVATQTATATATPVQPPTEKSNIPAYVTLGLAGAGAVVGGIFGGLALSSKGDFDKTPTAAKADETDRNALISDMAFAVALTFGVTGAVLLLSDSQPASAPPAKTGLGPQKPQKKAASVPRGFIAPYASPYGAGAAAKFTF